MGSVDVDMLWGSELCRSAWPRQGNNPLLFQFSTAEGSFDIDLLWGSELCLSTQPRQGHGNPLLFQFSTAEGSFDNDLLWGNGSYFSTWPRQAGKQHPSALSVFLTAEGSSFVVKAPETHRSFNTFPPPCSSEGLDFLSGFPARPEDSAELSQDWTLDPCCARH